MTNTNSARQAALAAVLVAVASATPAAAQSASDMANDEGVIVSAELSEMAAADFGLSDAPVSGSTLLPMIGAELPEPVTPKVNLLGADAQLNQFSISETPMAESRRSLGAFVTPTGATSAFDRAEQISLSPAAASSAQQTSTRSFLTENIQPHFEEPAAPSIAFGRATTLDAQVPVSGPAGREFEQTYIGSASTSGNDVLNGNQELVSRATTLTIQL